MVDWEALVLSARPLGPWGKAPPICSICWEEVETGMGANAACDHAFHMGCLETWKRTIKYADCPMCGEEL